jgi:hypothetical protein
VAFVAWLAAAQVRNVAMKDYLASIEELRRDAPEAALIRDLATDETKRQMYDRLCLHFSRLADEVEKVMSGRKETAD